MTTSASAVGGTVSGVSLIPTYTGRIVDPLSLRASDVCIEDIAHALARIGRFTGHTVGRYAYSVAQHCYLVSHICPKFPLWGLLHDASEAYLNDISRPLKYAPDFAGYLKYECYAQGAICERFCLQPNEPAEVKHADIVLLATEFKSVMPQFAKGDYWEATVAKLPPPLDMVIVPWEPQIAEQAFLDRFEMLTC